MTASPTLTVAAEAGVETTAAVANLVRGQADRVAAVVESTGVWVRDLWVTVGHLADDWPEQYAVIVSGAQRAIFHDSLAGFYTHAELATGVPAVRLAPTVDASKWLVKADGAHAKAANAELARRLDDGVPWEQAVDDVGAYLRGNVALDVQHAVRSAGDAMTSGPSKVPGLKGWRKVLSGGACGWCIVVADKRYFRAGTVSAHRFDRCGVAPWMDGEPWVKTYRGNWQDVMEQTAVPSDALGTAPSVLDPKALPIAARNVVPISAE